MSNIAKADSPSEKPTSDEQQNEQVPALAGEQKQIQAKINELIQHAEHDSDPANDIAELAPKLTNAQRRRLLLKLDFTVLLICWLLYFVNCLDRASIGNAGAYGFRQDVGASGNTFNIGVTLFYISYCLMEIPSNLAMKRVGAHFWLPAMGVLFGVVTLSTAFVKNRSQFLAVRFLLGIFEGATLPGCAYYLSMYYNRSEFSSRFPLFMTAGSISSGCASLLATALHGIGRITSDVYGWKNIFVINGILSIGISLFALATLPRDPLHFKLLSEQEKTFLMGQSAILTAGRSKEEATKGTLILRAFKNPSTWFGPWFCGQILSGSISYFLPEIFLGFGWSGTSANLHTAATFFVASGWIAVLGILSQFTKHHAGYIVFNLLIGIIGFCMFVYPESNSVRYGGAFLCVMSLYGGTGVNTSWVSANNQPYTTRSVAIATSVSLGALGGIVGSWVFIASEAADGYPTGQGLIFAFNALAVLTTIAHYLYCKWENKQRDLGRRDWRLNAPADEVALLGHLHPSFRFAT